MLKRLYNSFGYAFKGLSVLLKTQQNARIHAVATLLVVFLGLYFHISRHEWALILLAIGMVWSAEAFNTALESLTDLTSPQFHPLAGKAKDLGAAAVLIAAITSVFLAYLVFFPKILDYFK